MTITTCDLALITFVSIQLSDTSTSQMSRDGRVTVSRRRSACLGRGMGSSPELDAEAGHQDALRA